MNGVMVPNDKVPMSLQAYDATSSGKCKFYSFIVKIGKLYLFWYSMINLLTKVVELIVIDVSFSLPSSSYVFSWFSFLMLAYIRCTIAKNWLQC